MLSGFIYNSFFFSFYRFVRSFFEIFQFLSNEPRFPMTANYHKIFLKCGCSSLHNVICGQVSIERHEILTNVLAVKHIANDREDVLFPRICIFLKILYLTWINPLEFSYCLQMVNVLYLWKSLSSSICKKMHLNSIQSCLENKFLHKYPDNKRNLIDWILGIHSQHN